LRQTIARANSNFPLIMGLLQQRPPLST
jgi:hypothetical protein